MQNQSMTFENFETDIYSRYAFLVSKCFITAKKQKLLGIFGVPGRGKTRLLNAIANAYEEKGENVVFFSRGELKSILDIAVDDDIYYQKFKRTFSKVKLVCVDSVNEIFYDRKTDVIYQKLYRWWIDKKIRVVFTDDCEEDTYSVFYKIANSMEHGMLVGIPAPGQEQYIELDEIEWYCDNCYGLLNKQDGFDYLARNCTCSFCGFDNIFDKCKYYF